MDKAWLEEDEWQVDNSSSTENKPDMIEKEPPKGFQSNPRITAPLPIGLNSMIKREVSKMTDIDAETIIAIVEHVVRTKDNETLYTNLIEALQCILQDETKAFVGKVISYKKKMCRDVLNCTRGANCIFLHPNDDNNKRRAVDDTFNKRQRVQQIDNNEYSEVIFNRVPDRLSDIRKIREFASQFGMVRDVKNLKEGKFLIKYKTHNEAKKLMEDKELVLNDASITKFYNKFNKKTTEMDLADLFEKQSDVINKLYAIPENKELLDRLKWISSQIKSVVAPNDSKYERKEFKTYKNNNNENYKKTSFLCNSDFVMD